MSLFGRRFFISYRREDTQAFAQQLHGELELRYGGQRVFLDRADITHGVRWRDEVNDAVAQCDMVIALIGPHWTTLLRERDPEQDVLCYELATALRLNKTLVPVLVDGAVMPEASVLPAMLQPLPAIQALPVRTVDFDRGLRELLGILKPPWGLALAWGLGNAAALLIGALLLVFGMQAVSEPDVAWPHAGAIFVGALFGLTLALPQWFVLRHWFQRAAWVLPAHTAISAIGIAAGAYAGLGMGVALIAMLILPPLWGVVTWLVVRRELVAAGWWSLFNAISPFVGLMLAAPSASMSKVASVSSGDAPLVALFALLPQILSGVILVWLMRRSQMRPLPAAHATKPRQV